MNITLAADLIVVLHFAYVLVVIVGLLLILWGGWAGWAWVGNRWFRGIHLAMIGLVVAEAWLGIICPLTTLEKYLRSQAGQQTYRGDFIAAWVHDVLFFQAPPWVFTAAYTLFAALVLAALYWVPPHSRSRASTVQQSG